MPNFSHLQKQVNKLAEDFKSCSQEFTPPLQMQYMTEFPDSPQLRKLLELSWEKIINNFSYILMQLVCEI